MMGITCYSLDFQYNSILWRVFPLQNIGQWILVESEDYKAVYVVIYPQEVHSHYLEIKAWHKCMDLFSNLL